MDDKYGNIAFLLILLVVIGIFVYAFQISEYLTIERQAQKSIDNSSWKIKKMRNILDGDYIWLMIDVKGQNEPHDFSGNKISPCIIDYPLLIEMDSIPNWFDTIVVIKHYTKHSDTIKIALEDL